MAHDHHETHANRKTAEGGHPTVSLHRILLKVQQRYGQNDAD